MCQSYCFFFGCFLVFCLLLKNTIKIGFFDDFEMLIFSFFGQKSRVNNLAMVGSITWPSFWPKFCPERWPSYWPYSFHTFFVKTCFFFKNLILPAERRRCLKNKKHNKKNKKKDGQVIDLWWPSYWPYSIYIYICCSARTWSKIWVFWVKTWSKVASELGPRFFLLVFPSFIVFFGYVKNHK